MKKYLLKIWLHFNAGYILKYAINSIAFDNFDSSGHMLHDLDHNYQLGSIKQAEFNIIFPDKVIISGLVYTGYSTGDWNRIKPFSVPIDQIMNYKKYIMYMKLRHQILSVDWNAEW